MTIPAILTNEFGRFNGQQIINGVTGPITTYLQTTSIPLTQDQLNILAANNTEYLYMTFGQPVQWNYYNDILPLSTTASIIGGNNYITFTNDVSANIAPNDILMISAGTGQPVVNVGSFVVANVNTSNVKLTTPPQGIVANTCYVIRIRQGYSDNVIPNAATSYCGTMRDVWNNMIGGVLLHASDIAFVVPRYNWTANTVYNIYDPTDPNLFSKPFYVLTSNYDVYKCLDNNNNSQSTVMPVAQPTLDWRTPIQTSDGYVWKYLFSLNSADTNFTQKFLTNAYMPVKSLSVNAPEPINQWNVQEAAIDGAIDNIIMTNGGAGYVMPYNGPLVVQFWGGGPSVPASGIPIVSPQGTITGITITSAGLGYGANLTGAFSSNINSNVITFTGSSVPLSYNGGFISGNTIPSNTYIIAIQNSTNPKTITLSANATANGPIGSLLISGTPRVSFVGGAGTNASAIAFVSNGTLDIVNGAIQMANVGAGYIPPIVVNIVGDGTGAQAFVANNQVTLGGQIIGVTMAASGNGYTNTQVSISGGLGSNATARIYTGSKGGHGSDPVSELGAKNIMLVGEFAGFGGGNLIFSLGHSYRQISLIANPMIFGSNNSANAATFGQIYQLQLTSGLVSFVPGEIVYQQPQGSNTFSYSAEVVHFDNINNVLYVTNVFKSGSAATTVIPDITLNLKGLTSSAVRSFVSQIPPYLQPETGKVLFVENLVPITRANNQTEFARLVIAP